MHVSRRLIEPYQVSGLSVTFMASVAIQACGVGTGILSARLLGPQGRGELSAIVLWPSIIATVFSLGVVDSTAYFAGRTEADRTPSVLAASMAVLCALGCAAVATGLVAVPTVLAHYGDGVVQAALLYAFAYPLLTLLNQSPAAVLQGRGRLGWYNACRLSVPLVTLLMMVAFWIGGRSSVTTLAVASLLGNVLAIPLGLAGIAWQHSMRWRIDAELLRSMIAYGLRVQIGTVASILNWQMDKMLISALLPATDLGLYVVAATYAGGMTFVSTSLALAAFPMLLHAQRSGSSEGILARISRLNVLVTVPAVGLLAGGAHWLVPAIFGSEFSASVSTSVILLAASVPLGCNIFLSSGFRALGLPLQSSKADLVGLLMTVLCLPVLLLGFGIVGAAVASFCSYCGSLVYLCYAARRSLKVGLTVYLVPRSDDLLDLFRLRQSIFGARAKCRAPEAE